ncbi:MAG TPA: DinB family protein [Gemmatimonadaceae bacterium]|nr:DinB family protein [Gemmatimonadaceae bacterium]
MRISQYSAILAVATFSSVASAQAPVAAAFRDFEATEAKNLIAAARDIPAAKYSYKPTPAQMSVGDIVQHLNQGNDFLCGTIAGTKAPERAKLTGKSSKADLVAMLEKTFDFCKTSLAGLDDSKLNESMTVFGMKMTRAGVMTLTTGDWADHYSQLAIYMRLNGMLPPTAKKK